MNRVVEHERRIVQTNRQMKSVRKHLRACMGAVALLSLSAFVHAERGDISAISTPTFTPNTLIRPVPIEALTLEQMENFFNPPATTSDGSRGYGSPRTGVSKEFFDACDDALTKQQPAPDTHTAKKASSTPAAKPITRDAEARGGQSHMGSSEGDVGPKAAPALSAAPSAPVSAVINRDPLVIGFGNNQVQPNEAFKWQQIAAFMRSPTSANYFYLIGGHANRTGTNDQNRTISCERVAQVAKQLVAAGVRKDRLKLVGFGAAHPLQGTAPQSGVNRRVEIYWQ